MIGSSPYELSINGRTFILKKFNFDTIEGLFPQDEDFALRWSKILDAVWGCISTRDKSTTTKQDFLSNIKASHVEDIRKSAEQEYGRYNELLTKYAQGGQKAEVMRLGFSVCMFYGWTIDQVDSMSMTEYFNAIKYMYEIEAEQHISSMQNIAIATSAGFGSKEAWKEIEKAKNRIESNSKKVQDSYIDQENIGEISSVFEFLNVERALIGGAGVNGS